MQMLADDNFDLVVLDLNLPGADGMTVRSLTLRQLFSSASAMRTMFFAVMEKISESALSNLRKLPFLTE